MTKQTGKNVALLSRLHLATIAITIVAIPAPDFFSDPSGFIHASSNWVVLAAMLAMTGSFLLNRIGGFYRTSAILTGALIALFALALAPNLTGEPAVWMLYYLVIPVMICVLFLRARWIVLLVVSELLGICVMPFFMPKVPLGSMPILFIGLVSVLILIMVAHIKELERIGRNELAAGRQLYRGLLETLFDAVALVKDGCIMEANPGFGRLFGIGEGRTPGVPIADLISAWPSVRPGHVMETTGIGPNGTVLDIELVCNRVRGDESDTFVLAVRDITEQLRMQDEKKKLEEQLVQSQRMESIGRLAGGIAHDLNNILAVILGYGELIESELVPSSHLAEPIGEINVAGRRARELTRHLLAFSRRQVLEMRPLDLNAVVGGFEKMLRRFLREDIEMTVLLDPKARFVNADTTQIEQVLMNLCINARDAMPKGGALTVETGHTFFDRHNAAPSPDIAPGAYATLTVTDTGCGIDEATQKRIFEPFFTTKESGMGTGLGLSTVFGITKQHGGDIVVRSAPGQGTSFTIYLPALAKGDEETTAQEASETPSGKGETILVLEDDHSVRRLICRMLNELGYSPLETATADECMAAANKLGKIDLLLTDIVMPGMNGCEVHEQLAAKWPGIKTLFMSGYTGDILTQHNLEESGDQFIAKPFTQTALARKIRHALDTGHTAPPQ